MARITTPKRYDIHLTITVEQNIEIADDNKGFIVHTTADTARTNRFLKRLAKLCTKYGYSFVKYETDTNNS